MNLKKIIVAGATLYILNEYVYLGPEPKVIFADYQLYPCYKTRNSKVIASLHPLLRNSTWEICKQLEPYYNVVFAEGYRRWRRQFYLKKFTRSTKAAPGQSYHNYGLAVDVYLLENGKLVRPNSDIVNLFKSYGFQWGGDWPNFKDYGHFQKTFGYSWRTLLQKVKNRQLRTDGYVKL